MAKVICIMGPTASGKTNLAMHLYDELDAEIISVDSAMIYQDMDIGTAKPDNLDVYPHHLVDIVAPTQSYSAANFCHDAIKLIEQISARGKIPLLVGGTMMYYKALQQGLAELPSADEQIRQTLLARAKEKGWQAMHEELARVDKASAQAIHPNDPQRIQRALEVYYSTGMPLSQHWQQQKEHIPFSFINIGLFPEDRKQLHQLIAQRFYLMLEQGFIAEVKQLRDKWHLNASMPSMRAVGYRQAWSYLSGEYDKQTFIDKAIVATRQLAKRQLTWLRSWPQIELFDPFASDLQSKVSSYLSANLG